MEKLLFATRIDEVFETMYGNALAHIIKNCSENDILNFENTSILVDACKKSTIKTKLVIEKNASETSISMRSVAKGASGMPVERAFVLFIVPISGNSELLNYSPKIRTNEDVYAEIKGDKLIITIDTNYYNFDLTEAVLKNVNNEIKRIIEIIETRLVQIKKECDEHNETLNERFVTKLNQYKSQIQKKKELENKLNPFK